MYHGSKFDVPLSEPTPGMESIIGFYTTRIVEAGSEQEAKEKGVAQLLNEDEVKHLISVTRNTKQKEPVIEIESVQKLSWHQGRTEKVEGFTFYSTDEDT